MLDAAVWPPTVTETEMLAPVPLDTTHAAAECAITICEFAHGCPPTKKKKKG